MASPASRKPAIQEYMPLGYLGCLISSSLSLFSLPMLTIPTGAVTGYATWPQLPHLEAAPDGDLAEIVIYKSVIMLV